MCKGLRNTPAASQAMSPATRAQVQQGTTFWMGWHRPVPFLHFRPEEVQNARLSPPEIGGYVNLRRGTFNWQSTGEKQKCQRLAIHNGLLFRFLLAQIFDKLQKMSPNCVC